ncbi:hypothetical protein LXL04_002350 [Taraxacum kok-saghyz]
MRESLLYFVANLGVLQQQQWYEKKASIAEIDYSCKKLLQKLKAYKGEDLDVIHEATAFASSTVEKENTDLLLPPYPTRLSPSLDPDNGYLSHFSLTPKILTNDPPNGHPKGSSLHQSEPRTSLQGFRQVIMAVAKRVILIVGFIAALHLSGFEFGRRGSQPKVLGIYREQGNEEQSEMMVECP